MSPSTVQTSRFSFFSRETNLAFAPCSTASTRAIESFQRNPNGGTNSSAASAYSAKKTKEAIRPIRKIWPIIGWFERVTHIETRPMLSVSVASIYNLVRVVPPLAAAGNCAHRLIRSTRMRRQLAAKSVRPRGFRTLRGLGFAKFSTHCFRSDADKRALFLSQENFLGLIEN